MKLLRNAISENPYIRDGSITGSPGTGLIEEVSKLARSQSPNGLGYLKEMQYVIAILGFGDWATRPDVFQFLRKKHLKRIRNKQCFFVFDASLEGWSPTGAYSIFEYLHESCKKHKIDPNMVIYLTGNLEDEKNAIEHARTHGEKPCNVISFPAFEYTIASGKESIEPETGKRRSAREMVDASEQQCRKQFKDKLFSSLSRVSREHRIIGTFILGQHPVSKHALISHNSLEEHTLLQLKHWAVHSGYSEGAVKRWADKLPLVVDYSNFNENWAGEFDFAHIHDQTIFQIVNETFANDIQGTSMFFSEKTFRPVIMCQPFVIYGQVGCNHRLKELGYQLYDDWFDLSFDFEEDDVTRYRKMLESVNKACTYLNTLSREEQIAWRFKNREVLEHNCNVLFNSEYTRNKFQEFFSQWRA